MDRASVRFHRGAPEALETESSRERESAPEQCGADAVSRPIGRHVQTLKLEGESSRHAGGSGAGAKLSEAHGVRLPDSEEIARARLANLTLQRCDIETSDNPREARKVQNS